MLEPTISEKQEIASCDNTDSPVKALASEAEVVELAHLEDSITADSIGSTCSKQCRWL